MSETPDAPGGAGLREAEVVDGLAVWHARTVPELTDAVRWLAGQVQGAGGNQSEAITDLQAQMAALEARVAALEAGGPYATKAEHDALSDEVGGLDNDLTALEDRVAALEAPPAP